MEKTSNYVQPEVGAQPYPLSPLQGYFSAQEQVTSDPQTSPFVDQSSTRFTCTSTDLCTEKCQSPDVSIVAVATDQAQKRSNALGLSSKCASSDHPLSLRSSNLGISSSFKAREDSGQTQFCRLVTAVKVRPRRKYEQTGCLYERAQRVRVQGHV